MMQYNWLLRLRDVINGHRPWNVLRQSSVALESRKAKVVFCQWGQIVRIQWDSEVTTRIHWSPSSIVRGQ